jgi:hypothetical protein
MANDPELYLDSKLSWVAHITPEAVRARLDGFPLQARYSDKWLAGSIRRVYFCTVGDDFEDYPGTTHVRAELEQISEHLHKVIEAFESRNGWSESVMRRYASIVSQDAAGEDWLDYENHDLTDDEKLDFLYQKETEIYQDSWWAEGSLKLARSTPSWKLVRDQISGLYSLQAFMNAATDKLCSKDDPPRWRDMERRKKRISFASWLSAVFEVAYGKKATVNNWVDEDGQPKLGHWPDFFNRVGCLSLKLDRIPDLQGILKEARRRYKEERKGIFASDFLDETPP